MPAKRASSRMATGAVTGLPGQALVRPSFSAKPPARQGFQKRRGSLGRPLGQRNTGFSEGGALTAGHVGEVGAGDRVIEQAVIVELGVKMQEHAAEADRSAVHEHELARYSDRPLVTQTLMHTE